MGYLHIHSKEQRRKNMQAIKSKNTKIEIVLAKELWAAGYRYRRNTKAVYGKPDFSFAKYKIAIFCDSEFWHGKDWDIAQHKIGSNREFWLKKIQGNIDRDIKVNLELKNQGWTVLRFWEKDLKKDVKTCLNRVEDAINSTKGIR